MLKFLRRTLIGIVSVAILLAIYGLFLPDRIQMQRSIVIEAPSEEIFQKINDLRATRQWGPWHERDPNARYQYSGPDSGVGARVSWQSDHPEVGSGSQEIIESEEFNWIKTKLDFGAQGTATAHNSRTPKPVAVVSNSLKLDNSLFRSRLTKQPRFG